MNSTTGAAMTTSNQTGRVVDEVHTLLATEGDEQTLRRLIPAAIHLLAEGQPVRRAQIADAAGVPVDEAEAALRGIEDIEWTADGRVEGFGLKRQLLSAFESEGCQ
jgi:hypothetical protein